VLHKEIHIPVVSGQRLEATQGGRTDSKFFAYLVFGPSVKTTYSDDVRKKFPMLSLLPAKPWSAYIISLETPIRSSATGNFEEVFKAFRNERRVFRSWLAHSTFASFRICRFDFSDSSALIRHHSLSMRLMGLMRQATSV